MITNDLTKIEYLEHKQRECQLKKAAEERNQKLMESTKKLSLWKVIGGHGRSKNMNFNRGGRQKLSIEVNNF